VNSSGYLFYGDLLHLTSDGFAIVAQYVAKQLAAPLTLQAPSDLGLDTASQFGRTLSTRSDLYGNTVTPGVKLFAVGDFFSRNVAASDDNSPFDIDGVGGTIGAEYGIGGGAIGIAGNYSRPRVRFGNDSARINAHSWQVGAYGGLTSGGLSGQAYVGYGWDKHKITRAGVVENMSANPSGTHVLAGAKGTYLIPVGPAKVGPLLQVDYARAKVDGYTESGDPALNLNVGGQTAKSLTGQAGLEVRADFTGIHPYLDLTAEHEFASNNRVISFAQTSAPTIVNRWAISGGKDTYGRVAFGAAADLWNGMSLDAAVTTTLGKDGGRATAGHVGIRASF
jgi:outer membrane autotransporter protein